MDLLLQDKLVLVTGSTAGIGYAIAEVFAAEGARVIVNGRSEERVAAASASILKKYPQAHLESLVADLATAGAVEETIKRFPTVDVLVNNLGVYGPNGNL